MVAWIDDLKNKDIVKYMLVNSIKDTRKSYKVATIYEFDEEIAKTPFITTEAMAGFIRLAWWRENLVSITKPKSVPNNLLERLKSLRLQASNPEEVQKDFQRLLDSIEIMLEKQKFINEDELIERYIKLVSSAHAHLISDILGINYNKAIESLFLAYGIIGYIRSIPIYASYGWNDNISIMNLVKKAENLLASVNRDILYIPAFKIIYIATKFFIKYYLRIISSNEIKKYEPNMGLLRFKIALGLLLQEISLGYI